MVIPKPYLFWTLIFYPNVLFFALSYFDVKENYFHGRKSPTIFCRHTFSQKEKIPRGMTSRKRKKEIFFLSSSKKELGNLLSARNCGEACQYFDLSLYGSAMSHVISKDLCLVFWQT